MSGLMDSVVDFCVKEFKKPKNKKKVNENILKPVIHFILEEIKPYIFGLSVFLVSIILLMLFLCYLILVSGTKQ